MPSAVEKRIWRKWSTALSKKEEFFMRRKAMAKLTTEGWTVSAIAKKYGVSKQAVSQSLQKASKEGHRILLRKTGPHPNKNYDFLPSADGVVYDKKCLVCNKSFKTKNKKTKMCSKDCRSLYMHKKSIELKGTDGSWSRVKKKKLTCSYCKKIFERSYYIDSIVKRTIELRQKKPQSNRNCFCNRECYHKSTRKLKANDS